MYCGLIKHVEIKYRTTISTRIGEDIYRLKIKGCKKYIMPILIIRKPEWLYQYQ